MAKETKSGTMLQLETWLEMLELGSKFA